MSATIKHGNILSWVAGDPLPFVQFQQQQAGLIEQGWYVAFDRIDAVIGGSCAVCGCDQRIYLEMTSPGGDEGLSFDICLSCWSVTKESPVYEVANP